MEKMFEFATRSKMRFQSTRGELSVERLWEVPLRSEDGFDLNAVAQSAAKTLKVSEEQSFVDDNVEKDDASMPLEVIKYVIGVKLAEEAAVRNAAANKLKKQKLLRILAEKQDGELSDLSIAELQGQIEALA